nr:unnamed protein product [uncultured bacterium]
MNSISRLTGCVGIVEKYDSYLDNRYPAFRMTPDTSSPLYQILSEIYAVDTETGLPTEDTSLSSRTDLSPAALSVFRDILHKEYPRKEAMAVDDETLFATIRERTTQLGGENVRYADSLRTFIDKYRTAQPKDE